MAEILGTVASVISIAGLFTQCLNAVALISAAKRTDKDLRKLTIKLSIERCRLYTWGETLGLTMPDSDSKTTLAALEKAQFATLVKDTLEMILELFENTETLKKRYGCAQDCGKGLDPSKATSSSNLPSSTLVEDHDPNLDLATGFSYFHMSAPSDLKTPSREKETKATIVKKVFWVIQDKKKFDGLIKELRSFIDSLQEITKALSSATRQNSLLRYGVQQINNVETLELISDACKVDYPDISEAASVKLEVTTVGSYKRQEIEEWMSELDQCDAITTEVSPDRLAELEESLQKTTREKDNYLDILKQELRRSAVETNKLEHPANHLLERKLDLDKELGVIRQRAQSSLLSIREERRDAQNISTEAPNAETAAQNLQERVQNLEMEIDYYLKDIVLYKLDVKGYKKDLKRIMKANDSRDRMREQTTARNGIDFAIDNRPQEDETDSVIVQASFSQGK
jgi:hypothetical protein